MIAEGVTSPHIIEDLESNTEYTVKVVNRGGESEEVTFATKEITYKEVTIACDFNGKMAGSVVENPHIAKNVAHANLQNPASSLWSEFTQNSYNAIAELDNSVSKSSTSDNEKIAQALFSFDVTEAIERYDKNYFVDSNATTIAEKVSLILEKQKSMTFNVYGFSSGATGNKITVHRRAGSVWIAANVGDSNAVQRVTGTYTDGRLLMADGNVYILASATASDGITASVLNIDYANLELTILVEED
nr:hypothetical protein [Enterococcus sp. 9E7_DIV0242]